MAEGSRGETREERLVRIVKIQEAKIKAIWDEKNALKERLELANLDKELAEERLMAAESAHRADATSASELEARIAELEELRAVSTDLEESYIAQKRELTGVIEELRAELAATEQASQKDAQKAQARIAELMASQTSGQSLESLRQQLHAAKLELSAARLELSLEKHGMALALKPIFQKDAPAKLDLLAFVDFYALENALKVPFSRFGAGDLPLNRLIESIEAEVRDAEAQFASDTLEWKSLFTLLRSTTGPSPQLQALLTRIESGQHAQNIREALSQILDAEASSASIDALEQAIQHHNQLQQKELELAEVHESETPIAPFGDPANVGQELDTLKLRVRSLEAKLAQAQDLAAEIDHLKVSRSNQQARQLQLESLLAEAEELNRSKDFEIQRLKRSELPTNLDAAILQKKFKDMGSALRWYSRTSYPHLALDPLPIYPVRRPSVLTGNRRVSALRRAVLDFKLAETTEPGSWRPKSTRASSMAMYLFEKQAGL